MNKIKALGQNFLINPDSINNFLKFSELKKTDNVLEIGIGEGALTIPITKQTGRVVSIEIDQSLVLGASLWNIPNLKVINQNFLDSDLSTIIKENKINKIVAAIPYGITSPIIHKIIKEACLPLKEVNLVVQKEFGWKLVGDSKKRSYFTFLVNRFATIKNGEKIEKESFNPIPKVDSWFFSFSFTKYPSNPQEVVKWSKFLHFVFASPRKKINKRFKSDILSLLNIDENKRPENLTLEEVDKLYNNTREI